MTPSGGCATDDGRSVVSFGSLPKHRMLRSPAKDVHVHVYSSGSSEIERYKLLRDRLRDDAGDRELYARTKRELAKGDWPSMQHYAEAKTEVVEGIIARASAAKSARTKS